ncbi:MAG TPA: hypothetical protein VKZ53_13295 [Candidatus Angelobacter sp.]|nr:hypothetical protein [Candidatus Angelobacter sp.]
MKRTRLTSIIYLATAIVCSQFIFAHYTVAMVADERAAWQALVGWPIAFAVPLLFVFAYAGFLCAESTTPGARKFGARRLAGILNGAAVVAATTLFSRLARPFWENLAQRLDDFIGPSIVLIVPVIAIALWTIFLTSAIFLLLKKRSSLAIVTTILFWPYWFLLALIFVGRLWQDRSADTAFYFLCFCTPVLLTASAGIHSYRPAVANWLALGSIAGAIFLYQDVVRGNALYNVWIEFNQSFRSESINSLFAVLAILSVALLALSILTAATRLLPSRWRVGGSPLREQTWPAFAITLVFVAAWYSRSVMPYRIPGAVDVDYASFPVLQILHIEKRGLQFHEACIDVWSRPDRKELRMSLSGNNRRWLQYRFQQVHESAQIPEALGERIKSMLKTAKQPSARYDHAEPLRDWNADGWYFYLPQAGMRVYGTPNKTAPPQEITDLFHDLDKIPRSPEGQTELKDVCLGFCYDPYSAMGWLTANYRCSSVGDGYVCR